MSINKKFIAAKQAANVLTPDQAKITYDLYPAGKDQLVVIAPGFFNSKDSVLLQILGAELWPEYDVLLLDFRGHGTSQGVFYWTTKEYLDLQAVLDAVKDQYQQIALIGFSLGAATSIIVASQYEHIDSLIAVSGPTEFERIDYHFWDLDMENDVFFNLTGAGRQGKGVRPGPFWLKKDKPVQKIAQVRCPVFILHGSADWLIKPWHAQELFARATSEKELAIIDNGPHAEYLVRKNKSETVRLIRDWLGRTLSEGKRKT